VPTVSPLTSSADVGGIGSRVASFFDSLGIAYRGPVDGHDEGQLERELRALTDHPGPVVLHVHTVKGRGYAPAESDDDKRLHDIGPFDPATGVQTGAGGPTYTEVFTGALLAEAEAHPELVALTAAMAGPTGLAPFRDRYPDRFFDVGIAEQHAVTTAAGMAMGGLRPPVAIYSTFLNRAWDQIYYDVGLHGLPVIFRVDRAGVTGEDGPSHHGLLDLALLTKVPAMTVLVPSSSDDIPIMLRQALEITSGPVAIQWPKGRASSVGLPARRRPPPDPASAVRLRAGDGVCLLGVGKMVAGCEDAADILTASGLSVTVWDVRVAAPLDQSMLDDAGRHPVAVTAEDGVVEGGVGALVAAALGRSTGRFPAPRVVVRGVPVQYVAHGRAEDILAGLGLDGAGLSASALHALRALEAVEAAPSASTLGT
jgi:1-deoxy-D-xylulose-5-phosphate synthase